ncbi:diguanylate cyclase domain-containing protein [Dokdonella koreensis]|uniref:diguanylate cyclase n=1 Tax=Dokdonella koreensis DS-123 TaxID=1300342 RepID=A0A160DU76_9GAMM|nr:diguanylate cyclase [Dokdonella koreensis]ANB17571.1 Response regulator receiver modulated diguanylate cyclase [Dokdonella koreensis DS-123]
MQRARFVTGCCIAFALPLAAGSQAAPSVAPDFPSARVAAGSHRIAEDLDDLLQFAAAASGATLTPAGRLQTAYAAAYLALLFESRAIGDRRWAQVQALAERSGDPRRVAEALQNRAEIALQAGDYRRCEELVGRLSGLASPGAEATAELFRAVLERRQGRLGGALRHGERALDLYRRLGDRLGEAQALANLGTAMRDRGDYAKALDLQLEALAIRERYDEQTETSYRNIALIYRAIEDSDAAAAYFTQALDAARRRGAPSLLAPILGSYAGLLNDLERYEEALAAAREALAIDQAIGSRPSQGLERLEAGRALAALGRRAEAEAELEQTLALGRELGQREIVATALLNLARVALDQRDRLRARALLDEALAGLETSQLKPQLAQAYELREQLATAEHDTTAALRYLGRRSALREEMLGARTSRQLAALQVRHARHEAEQRNALLTKENELQATRLHNQRLERQFGLLGIGTLLVVLGLVSWRYVSVKQRNRLLAENAGELERQRQVLSDANVQLERQAAELYHAAVTDPLTGTHNRGHLLRELNERILDAQTRERDLSLLLIDFDHFKQLNDLRGHLFGDRALVVGVQAMRQWLEPGDLLGRFGGEEFLIVLTRSDAAAALEVAERICEKVGDALRALDPDGPACTISIGIASLALVGSYRLEALIDAADQALYAAKASGRNRVIRYPSPTPLAKGSAA